MKLNIKARTYSIKSIKRKRCSLKIYKSNYNTNSKLEFEAFRMPNLKFRSMYFHNNNYSLKEIALDCNHSSILHARNSTEVFYNSPL